MSRRNLALVGCRHDMSPHEASVAERCHPLQVTAASPALAQTTAQPAPTTTTPVVEVYGFGQADAIVDFSFSGKIGG